MRVGGPLRWIASVLFGLFFGVVILNINKAAEKHGWDLYLIDLLEGKLPALISNLIFHPIAPWVAVAVIFFTFGLWIDTLVRRFDANIPSKQARYDFSWGEEPIPDDWLDAWWFHLAAAYRLAGQHQQERESK